VRVIWMLGGFRGTGALIGGDSYCAEVR
jgi:hypothetical protein